MRKAMQNKVVKEQVKINQENNRNQLLKRLKNDVDLMRKTKQVLNIIKVFFNPDRTSKNKVCKKRMKNISEMFNKPIISETSKRKLKLKSKNNWYTHF